MRVAIASVYCVFASLVTFASFPFTVVSTSSDNVSIETSSSTSCGSTKPYYIGDSLCNAFNNNEDCDYDGGDCCNSTCEGPLCGGQGFQCIDPSVECGPADDTATPAPFIVIQFSAPASVECKYYGGNGACDQELNNSDCDYDKGDCCPCDCSDDDNYGNPYIKKYYECGFEGWAYCANPEDQNCDW